MSTSSIRLEKLCTKIYVVATTFTMFLLLLLISHIISLLLTVETGGKNKKEEIFVECHCAEGLSEIEYRECHSHTKD
jgi:hypothetical protein